MATTEAGHEPNRCYIDRDGHFHMNGSNIYLDELGNALSPTEASYFDGVSAGTVTASKGLLVGASKELSGLGTLTFADAANIVVNATTGTKIGTATTQKIGFYNAAPVVQPSAYTQTYSTADKTHAALTSQTVTMVANVSGATENYVIPDSSATVTQAEYRVLAKTFALLFQQTNADLLDVKQLLNSVIDDLQALGLVA